MTNSPTVPWSRPPSLGAAPHGLISVVVPVFDEQAVLEEFHRRLGAVLDALPQASQIVYVNDGSRDRSLEILLRLRNEDPRVGVIDLSRNFGKEAAMTAGLDAANGDAVIIIDADLQDPPELIPQLIAPWEKVEADVVYAQRRSRAGETWLKKATASAFYRVMERFGRTKIPPDTGDFRLLSRRAKDDLLRLREQHRFMKGLYAWIGYKQVPVIYDRDPRHAGKSKWNYLSLIEFALDAITGATIAPLKLATFLGLATGMAAMIFGLVVIYKTLVYGNPVDGYPSLMVVILFLGGIQLMTLGILGEYIGRISNESKQRPLYLVKTHLPARDAPAPATEDEQPQVKVVK